MKKFLVLYMAPTAAMDEMMRNSTPEMRKQGMDEWMTWMEAHKSDLADGGAPLGKNKRVTAESISDMRNEIGGYSIVQAETQDDAAKIVQSSPNFHLHGGYIEVMEVMSM